MRKQFLIFTSVLAVLLIAGAALYAATGASISFTGYTSGDDSQFTLSGWTDDGSNCDEVAVMWTDATGGITDIDWDCVISGGTSSSGYSPTSYEGGYDATTSPVTVSVFDLPGSADPCDSDENSAACGDYLLTQATCIGEAYWDLTDLPFTASAFPVCGSVAGSGCTLNIPEGSVVGEAPLGAQVYYSPGNVASGVVLNPGTYIVVGQDESATYYKIVLACQFVWVRQDTMQPSFLPPQNGAPLPTRIVS